LFAAATDFTWPDAGAGTTREALRTIAAKTRFFMVVLTLSKELPAHLAGAFSFGAVERSAQVVING
jgi:hypothetical protein